MNSAGMQYLESRLMFGMVPGLESTFKICEAVKLGLDKFFLEENKPIKITEAHTDFAKRIIPTLPRGWMQQKHSWDACKR